MLMGRNQIHVYYVGQNPKNPSKLTMREIWSDDLGATWEYGHLGGPDKGKYYSVMAGSAINAIVLLGKNELRVYFTSADSQSLAVVWMPAAGDPHAGDWNVAQNLYPVDKPW